MAKPARPKSAADYARALLQLLPRGRAWQALPQGRLAGTLEASAQELARVDAAAYLLTREVNPALTQDALSDWEEILGLPDSCLPSGSSMQERRAAVIYKLNDVGRTDMAWYMEQAEAMGYNITAYQHQPFMCGVARCGDPLSAVLGNPDVSYWLHFIVHGGKITYFECGASRLPAYLGTFQRAQELECVFTRDKPAHILITFTYEDN